MKAWHALLIIPMLATVFFPSLSGTALVWIAWPLAIAYNWFCFPRAQPWVSIGAALNGCAVIANRGLMPVYAEFWNISGQTSGTHQLMTSGSRLWFLCDVLPGACSLGDVILYIGFILGVCRWAWHMHHQKAEGATA